MLDQLRAMGVFLVLLKKARLVALRVNSVSPQVL